MATKDRPSGRRIGKGKEPTTAEIEALVETVLKKRAKRHKRIEEYTDAELNSAIRRAAADVTQFWTIMKGVDAYMERRKRRKAEIEDRIHREIMSEIMREKEWGDD